MKKSTGFIVFFIVAAVAAGIVYYQSRQSATAPVSRGIDIPQKDSENTDLAPLETDATLAAIKSQSGLAFSAARNSEFLWFAARDKIASKVNGQVATVGAVSLDEINTIDQIFKKIGFKADEANLVTGYNAKLAGYVNGASVCLLESGGNLVNRSDNPSNSNIAGQGDIRVYCGKAKNTGTAKKLPDSENFFSFKACFEAGYPVIASNPRQCITPGEIFMDIKTCKAPGGEILSVDEAIKIEEASICAKEGSMKGEFYCNEATGTWWIDLVAFKAGCNPACVINVAAKTAEINWRCTGLKP